MTTDELLALCQTRLPGVTWSDTGMGFVRGVSNNVHIEMWPSGSIVAFGDVTFGRACASPSLALDELGRMARAAMERVATSLGPLLGGAP